MRIDKYIVGFYPILSLGRNWVVKCSSIEIYIKSPQIESNQKVNSFVQFYFNINIRQIYLCISINNM